MDVCGISPQPLKVLSSAYLRSRQLRTSTNQKSRTVNEEEFAQIYQELKEQTEVRLGQLISIELRDPISLSNVQYSKVRWPQPVTRTTRSNTLHEIDS